MAIELGKVVVLSSSPKYPNIFYTADINSDGIAEVVLEVNPWKVKTSRGRQLVLFDASSNTMIVDIDVEDVEPADWVNGYPEIYVGRKPWYPYYATMAGLKFPLKLSELHPFTVSFYICLEYADPAVNLNIAADAWITRREVAESPSAAGPGDVEIMVWLYNQNLTPAGGIVGTEVLPIVVNGKKMEVEWEVWRMDSVPWGGWQYIAFKPRSWTMKCGHVAYDPTLFIKAMRKYATVDLSQLYLMDWEIGTEWGTRTSNGKARLKWILKDFRVLPNTTVA